MKRRRSWPLSKRESKAIASKIDSVANFLETAKAMNELEESHAKSIFITVANLRSCGPSNVSTPNNDPIEDALLKMVRCYQMIRYCIILRR